MKKLVFETVLASCFTLLMIFPMGGMSNVLAEDTLEEPPVENIQYRYRTGDRQKLSNRFPHAKVEVEENSVR